MIEHLPILQIVVPLNIRVADRFLLFALPALALGVARVVQHRRTLLPAAVVAATCLATLSLDASPAWASDTTLWQRTADRVPGHWRS